LARTDTSKPYHEPFGSSMIARIKSFILQNASVNTLSFAVLLALVYASGILMLNYSPYGFININYPPILYTPHYYNILMFGFVGLLLLPEYGNKVIPLIFFFDFFDEIIWEWSFNLTHGVSVWVNTNTFYGYSIAYIILAIIFYKWSNPKFKMTKQSVVASLIFLAYVAPYIFFVNQYQTKPFAWQYWIDIIYTIFYLGMMYEWVK
jgi:hypothetical protein